MLLVNYNQAEQALQDIEDKNMIRLIFVSTITDESKKNYKAVFEHILYSSEHFNVKHHITGFLCNDSNYFAQCLEGAKSKILLLMQNIFSDFRHKNVVVVLAYPIKKQAFTQTRMHSLSLNEQNWPDSLAQTHLGELQPFVPFKPQTWPQWFIEYFISSMKQFDKLDGDDVTYGSACNIITPPKNSPYLNLLSSDMLYFYLFLGLMASTLGALAIFSGLFS